MAIPSSFWRISVFKNWLSIGGKPWVNTYELFTLNPVFIDDIVLDTFAENVAQFEQALHTTSVFIDRVVVSTWERDGTPYDPATFRVITQALQGERDPGAFDRIDLNAVLKVRRDTATGRAGKLAFRGVLTENDVTANASGFWELNPASPVALGGGTWVTAIAFLADFFGDGTPLDGSISLIKPTSATDPTPQTRVVNGFTPVGAGFNQVKKKFYNRVP